jgi:hypothetical protein
MAEDVKDITNKVIVAVPASLVALLVIDLVFIFGLVWFIHSSSLMWIDAIKELFHTCASAVHG